MRRVTDIARESGCRIIIDEVQTGFMRTGELWVHETYGIKPDMLNIGKAMGGGLPLSGVVAEFSDFSALQTPAFSHVTTFGGNPVCCASGLAAFKQIVGMRQEVRSLSEQFDRWAERVSKLGLLESVSGLGLMRGLHFFDSEHAYDFVARCQKDRLLLGYKLNNSTAVRFAPPLTTTEEQMNGVLALMSSTLEEVCAS